MYDKRFGKKFWAHFFERLYCLNGTKTRRSVALVDTLAFFYFTTYNKIQALCTIQAVSSCS